MEIEFDKNVCFICKHRVRRQSTTSMTVTLPLGRGFTLGDVIEFFSIPGIPRDVMVLRKVKPSNSEVS